MCPCSIQPCANSKSTADDFHELKPLHVTWRINEQQRASYLDQLSTFSGVLPSTFVLPSRLSMARYVAGFVDGLSHHFPFIHMPTFSITAIPDAPELVLALMAIGAQYRYERRSATALYHAARAIIAERIRRRELPDPHAAAFHHETLPRMPPNLLATTRAILLLAKFAAWQASPALIRESLSYRALLAHTVSPGWAAGLGAASPVQRSGPALLCPGCAGGARQGHVAGQEEAHGRWWDWQCPTCPQGQEAAPRLCRRAGLAVAVAGEGRVHCSCPPCLPCLPLPVLPVLPALPAPAFRPRV